MSRSMKLFKSLGLNPIAAPVDFRGRESSDFFELPGLRSFIYSQIAIHEYLGTLWSKLRGQID